MDEIVKKLAGLGLPGILVVLTMAASGGSSAAVVALITSLGGPFGLIGGLGVLGLLTTVGDAIAGFGIENLLKLLYTERSKNESVRLLLKEIKDLPITDELKLKLKHHLTTEVIPEPEVQAPKTIEIVEEE